MENTVLDKIKRRDRIKKGVKIVNFFIWILFLIFLGFAVWADVTILNKGLWK